MNVNLTIDFHTHFYPDSLAPRAIEFGTSFPQAEAFTNGTRKELEKSMDRAGIDVSVCLPLANSAENVDSINRFAIANNSEKIIMLGTIHPDTPDNPAVIAELSKADIKGIKLHPEFQQFDFFDSRMTPLWKSCIEHNMFILTHAGADIAFKAPFRTNPAMVAEFHKKYPELNLVAAHFGSWGMWDEVEKHLIGLPIQLDLGYTAGFIPPEKMVSMIRKHGVEKILFGTDSPWRDQKSDMEFIKSLPLTESELKMIMGGNAARILGLKQAYCTI